MLRFKRLKQDLVHKSKIVSLYKDFLQNPNDEIVEYDLIKHKYGGGAGVLVVDENENVFLVQQYRNSVDDISIEIPAGGYSYIGESGEECARREAEEETGYIPQKMFHVSNVVDAIGTFDEKTDIYIGMELDKGKVNLDVGEFVELLIISFDEALKMIYDGKIFDSKTIIALLAYQDMKNRGIL